VATVKSHPAIPWLLSMVSPLQARIGQRRAAVVSEELPPGVPGGDPGGDSRALADAVVSLTARMSAARARFEAFSGAYSLESSPRRRRRLAAEHLARTVTRTGRWRGRLRGDRAALRRHLDLTALEERFLQRVHELGGAIELCLEALERNDWPPASGTGAALVELTATSEPAFPMPALLRALAALDAPVDGPARERVARWAVDTASGVDLQRASLGLLTRVDRDAGLQALERRLTRPSPPRDDFLVRAAAVRLAAAQYPVDTTLLQSVQDDPSEHVRLTWVRVATDHEWGDAALISRVAGQPTADPSPRVRAVAARGLATIAGAGLDSGDDGGRTRTHAALESLLGALGSEEEPLAQRVTVDAAARCVVQLCAQRRDPWSDGWLAAFVGALARLSRGEGADLAVAHHTAAALGTLRSGLDAEFAGIVEEIARAAEHLRPGGRKRLRPPCGDARQWGEALALVGRADLGLSGRTAGKSLVIQRGDRFDRSLARVLHEVRHRAPDKRQAGAHTSLPRRLGTLRAPPLGMAAATTTGVPAEPVVAPALGSWGPHLPTVADCLDAARSGRVLNLFHPHGVTELHPPRGVRRWSALWSVRWNLGRLDVLRQRSLEAGDAEERAAFADALTSLGYRLESRPASATFADDAHDLRNPELEQFFGRSAPAALALSGLASLPGLADQAWRYLFSHTGNSLVHLTAFIGGLGAVVLGDAVVQAARIRRWRRRIPLVIGGSGTRGKSGTERLKAALLHSCGAEVLCKTTGNEAMVIHSSPGLRPRELLLYRPYDKATIWEQRDVLRLAARLGVQALTWECMALNPRYIEILALEWMRDDLTTLTNCYPDHEDVQGPSGREVAESLARFVPNKGVLVTTEQEMAPILRQTARDRSTRFVPVPAVEADLIAEDLLDRFPYREHPRNVALVASLAAELGLDPDDAIERMADHLVPDIGALKQFPTVPFAGRRLSFINGHSANERTGFLNNWQRTGMADFDPARSRGEWVGAVINNRADRVTRSRAFAAIVAGDVSAHALCLVGTNLAGFVGYLRRALVEEVSSLNLGDDVALARERFARLMGRLHLRGWQRPDDLLDEVCSWLVGCGVSESDARRRLEDTGFAEAALSFLARRKLGTSRKELRRALDDAARDTALTAAVESLCDGVTGDRRDAQLRHFVRRQVALTAAVAAAARAVEQDADRTGLSRGVGRLFVDLVLERTHRLRDPHASGDQVLDFVCSCFPPGVHARVMGMQNIKGTGLDFVYRWISLERVGVTLDELRDAQPARALELLRWLRGHPDYGVLDARLAHGRVAALADSSTDESVRSAAAACAAHLSEVVRAREGALVAGRRRRSPFTVALQIVENALDYLHSIHRRRASNRVLDDLVHHRVSHARAAALLREITSVQKGGWLSGGKGGRT
jgi:gamma-polyglutamate synthase